MSLSTDIQRAQSILQAEDKEDKGQGTATNLSHGFLRSTVFTECPQLFEFLDVLLPGETGHDNHKVSDWSGTKKTAWDNLH